MNNILGTTVLLSSSNDYFLKQFASVIIYLDNGHISKIRKGFKKIHQRKIDKHIFVPFIFFLRFLLHK